MGIGGPTMEAAHCGVLAFVIDIPGLGVLAFYADVRRVWPDRLEVLRIVHDLARLTIPGVAKRVMTARMRDLMACDCRKWYCAIRTVSSGSRAIRCDLGPHSHQSQSLTESQIIVHPPIYTSNTS